MNTMHFKNLLKTLLAGLAIAGVGASSAATFAYVSNAEDDSISRYRLDPASGALRRTGAASGVAAGSTRQKGAVRPPLGQGEKVDDTPRIWAADLRVTPDGRFVYMSERTSSISWFRVDAASGQLQYAGNLPVEKQPHGFNIDPRGKHLIVAGEKASEVGVYAIDANDGGLRRVGGAPAGKGANWVEIVEFN